MRMECAISGVVYMTRAPEHVMVESHTPWNILYDMLILWKTLSPSSQGEYALEFKRMTAGVSLIHKRRMHFGMLPLKNVSTHTILGEGKVK
jgi:hypothetical protein